MQILLLQIAIEPSDMQGLPLEIAVGDAEGRGVWDDRGSTGVPLTQQHLPAMVEPAREMMVGIDSSIVIM